MLNTKDEIQKLVFLKLKRVSTLKIINSKSEVRFLFEFHITFAFNTILFVRTFIVP